MKQDIALKAWELVTDFPSLKKLNFLPSFFGICWLLLVVFYQITYTFVEVFNKKDDILHFLYSLPETEYFIPVIIAIAFIFIAYSILNPLAKGWMIHMMHTYRKNEWKKFHRSWQGFFDGLSHFLPIFEIQNITAIFAPITIITATIFLMRLFWKGYWEYIWIIMGVYLLFAFIFNICFSYAPFYAIFENKKGLESLSASTKLAINNISITAQLYFTNILLSVRTLIVWAIFLLLPFIASSLIAFITILELKMIFIVIFSGISLLLLIFIAQLNSALEIFVLAVWHEAYLACKKEDEIHAIGH